VSILSRSTILFMLVINNNSFLFQIAVSRNEKLIFWCSEGIANYFVTKHNVQLSN